MDLSRREIETLQLICKEYSSKQIADKMGLSIRTIDGYRKSILKKSKAKNLVGIVLYALRNGIYKL